MAPVGLRYTGVTIKGDSYVEFMRRFGTLALAGLFILTSIAFTAVLFWSARNEEDSSMTAQQQLQDQLNQANNLETGENQDMLQGTKLANFTPIPEPVENIEIIDVEEGTGDPVPEGATITAHYTLAITTDGVVIESSHDAGQPLTRPLSGLIVGWQQGIPGMKAGGKRRLIIPATLAYNDGRDMVFDIELISFE